MRAKNYPETLNELQEDSNASIEAYKCALSNAIDMLIEPDFFEDTQRINITKSLVSLKIVLDDLSA